MPHDGIFSAHFIGGEKADEQDSPSYVSVIFPATDTSTMANSNLAIAIYKRHMKRISKIEKNRANSPN